YAFRIEQHFAESSLLQRHNYRAQHLWKDGQQQGPQYDTRYAAHATQHYHAQNEYGFCETETLGADKALHRRKQAAGYAAKRRTHGEGEQLDVACIDTHRLGGDFVLTNCFPGPANPGMLQARADNYGEQGEKEQQVIVFFRAGDAKAENFLCPAEGKFPHAEGIDAVDAL